MRSRMNSKTRRFEMIRYMEVDYVKRTMELAGISRRNKLYADMVKKIGAKKIVNNEFINQVQAIRSRVCKNPLDQVVRKYKYGRRQVGVILKKDVYIQLSKLVETPIYTK
jgi:hypothetical protein